MKYYDMIHALGWNDKQACKELNCNMYQLKKHMKFESMAILVSKYNQIVKPTKEITLNDIE